MKLLTPRKLPTRAMRTRMTPEEMLKLFGGENAVIGQPYSTAPKKLMKYRRPTSMPGFRTMSQLATAIRRKLATKEESAVQ